MFNFLSNTDRETGVSAHKSLREKKFFRLNGIFYVQQRDRYIKILQCFHIRVSSQPRESATVNFA